MRRRERPEDVKLKAFGNLGYGSAFETGEMHGALFGLGLPETEDTYTLPELRAAWAEYRTKFLERRRARDSPPSWAELVFDERMDPDEARRTIETNLTLEG